MDSLTPQDLFSPSKARQQRAQAADWAHLDSWLSCRYAGHAIPAIERNEETLKALRELVSANVRADEDRIALEHVERAALKELTAEERMHNFEDAQILELLRSQLTPEGAVAVSVLASTAVALDSPSEDPVSLAHALANYFSISQTFSKSILHVDTLVRYLEKQHVLLRAQLQDTQAGPVVDVTPVLQGRTIGQIRQTKTLCARLRECEDRLLALQGSQHTTSMPISKGAGPIEVIADLLEQHESLEELRHLVDDLRIAVDVYEDLSADMNAARKELGKFEVELDSLRRKRDILFENLVNN